MTRIALIGGQPHERQQVWEWASGVPGVLAVTALTRKELCGSGTLHSQFDVVLGVIGAAEHEGLAECRRFLDDDPAVKFVAVLVHPTEARVRRVCDEGATAITSMSSGAAALRTAIAVVIGGAAWLDPALSTHVLGHISQRAKVRNGLGLTAQQYRVANHFDCGLSNTEIEVELGIGPETVKTHVRIIYAKLGVSTRSSVVQRLREDRCAT